MTKTDINTCLGYFIRTLLIVPLVVYVLLACVVAASLALYICLKEWEKYCET